MASLNLVGIQPPGPRHYRMTSFLQHALSLTHLSSPQTREQEELEELLLLEQQGSEQRRLEALQEEQRQLSAKRKNKQALLDELVSNTRHMYICPQMDNCSDAKIHAKRTSPYVRCSMSNTLITHTPSA